MEKSFTISPFKKKNLKTTVFCLPGSRFFFSHDSMCHRSKKKIKQRLCIHDLSVLWLQDSLRGRPKEIPHNEKLLSLKFEVNQPAQPQTMSAVILLIGLKTGSGRWWLPCFHPLQCSLWQRLCLFFHVNNLNTFFFPCTCSELLISLWLLSSESRLWQHWEPAVLGGGKEDESHGNLAECYLNG